MTREELHEKVKIWIDEKEDISNKWHYGKLELHRDIDRTLSYVRSEHKSIDEINEKALRSLISKIINEKNITISPIQNEDYLQGRKEVLDTLETWINELNLWNTK